MFMDISVALESFEDVVNLVVSSLLRRDCRAM
jgi:hypothetical protein